MHTTHRAGMFQDSGVSGSVHVSGDIIQAATCGSTIDVDVTLCILGGNQYNL